MPDRLTIEATPRLRDTLVIARQIAIDAGVSRLGVEHLLLAIVRTQASVVGAAFAEGSRKRSWSRR